MKFSKSILLMLTVLAMSSPSYATMIDEHKDLDSTLPPAPADSTLSSPNLDQSIIAFQSTMEPYLFGDIPAPLSSEKSHEKIAKVWVKNFFQFSNNPESFMTSLWYTGQQLASLMRNDDIYLMKSDVPKGTPKKKAFVIENQIRSAANQFCSAQATPALKKSCTNEISTELLDITQYFWTKFREEAVADFTKQGLNPAFVTFKHVQGQIHAAFQDSHHPLWGLIHDYLATIEKYKLNDADIQRVAHQPNHDQQMTSTPESGIPTNDVNASVHDNVFSKVRRTLARLVTPKDPQAQVPAQGHMAWNAVTADSSANLIKLAQDRYSKEIVWNLGCSHFAESCRINGQILAQVSPKTDFAQISDEVSKSVEKFCIFQFATAGEVQKCKGQLEVPFANLTKLFLKETPKKKDDIDQLFSASNSSKINDAINGILEKIKNLDPPLKCFSTESEATGPYLLGVDSETSFLAAKSMIQNAKGSPSGRCAHGVKTGFNNAGVFTAYPGWPTAYSMLTALQNTAFIKKQYKFSTYKITSENEKTSGKTDHEALTAPMWSTIVYDELNDNGSLRSGSGKAAHVEMKVPIEAYYASGGRSVWAGNKGQRYQIFLRKDESGKVRSYIMNKGVLQLMTRDLDAVYVSDYVDAFPRSDPRSRIARPGSKENKRPVAGIFLLERTN